MSTTGPGADESSTAGTPARLETRHLRIVIASSGADIVDEVSFTVRPGEVLGLVGESGSGKTTVALALLGHTRRGLSVAGGEINLDGRNLLSLKPAELRSVRGGQVAYVPQDPSAALNPTLSIGLQLRETLAYHPGAVDDVDARVIDVLRDAQLDTEGGLLKRYPHQLSGGQQQRVALAMAFSCRPGLIVFDEPTTGLDVSTQRGVLETVRSLCRRYNTAAVYVSHDLAVVSGLVTQVAVMYAGRIIELGSTEQIFRFPAHPYTRGLIQAVPSPDRTEFLSGMKGQPPGPGSRPKGCSFAPRCPHADKRCSDEDPPPVVARGRLVRCLRVNEIGDGPVVGRHAPMPVSRGAAQSILELKGVSASYGRNRVLFEVNLAIQPGFCTAIVGESGSGKTTLAQCIVGLHPSWSGQMSFEGTDLPSGTKRRPPELLRRVQYIFQNPYTSLNPRKTISQIVSQPLEHFSPHLSARERDARVVGTLEEVSLGLAFLRRFPDQLSGGERQRVAIARALAVEPDLLVCDEVTSALDVSVQAVIVELLRRLQSERRLAMIFITHNLALVRTIAQSVVVLCEGRLVETGSVEQVLEHPADEYTKRLIRDVPKLERGAAATQGRVHPSPDSTQL